MDHLDELIFNVIESLRNNKKLNQDSIYATVTSVTMEKLKERLTIS